jgi:hypothetical protein
MNSDDDSTPTGKPLVGEEMVFEANKIARTLRLKHLAWGVGALAAVAWAVSGVIQSRQNSDLIAKNNALVEIVKDLETQNEDLDHRLKCRSDVRDNMDRAIGRGLAAVAQDDTAELQRQAEIILEVVDTLEQCE